MPARIESRVVLPAPFGPITASSSPLPAARLTSRNAARWPKDFERPSTSSTGAAGRRGARGDLSFIAEKLEQARAATRALRSAADAPPVHRGRRRQARAGGTGQGDA